VFPAMSACGSIHSGTIKGKLNGVMPAQTPSGSCFVSHVMPRLTYIFSPVPMLAREQPISVHSMAFATLPWAWARSLPFSWQMSQASSSKSRSMSDFRR